MRCLALVIACFVATTPLLAQARMRARDLGIPFDGTPGPLNAITDIAGIEVGMSTLISGDAIRTGVTAILPRGKASADPVFAGWFALNGNGEMTGTTWIEESGFLEGPVLITNTHSVGTVRDASIQWALRRGTLFQPWALPVVAETYDGLLNDINGFHVKPEHVFAALDGAAPGPVAEGNVGGGTGMRCYGFKCGTGTASRRIPSASGTHTVGVLVQANHGAQRLLQIAGVPVARSWPGKRGGTMTMRSGPHPSRSSSSSPRTHPSCRISSSASRSAHPSASPGQARSPTTDPATSSSHSPPRIPAQHRPRSQRRSPCSPISAWARSSRQRCRQPKKR